MDTSIQDTKSLGLLVSCLSPFHEITSEFLRRGGLPRKRWTTNGNIEEVEATTAGLSPELTHLLSDSLRLKCALDGLLSTAVLRKVRDAYELNDETASHIRQGISGNELDFWKRQALVVTCSVIPWKYIEPGNPQIPMILSHLQHTVESYQDHIEALDMRTKIDLGHTLLEASRFSKLAWKRTAVEQAAKVTQGLEDWCLSASLASTQCLLHRLDGNIDSARYVVDEHRNQKQPVPQTPRANSTAGNLTIQRALNCIQIEDLSQAEQLLNQWRPFDQKPSLMESTVLFRKGLILGRIMRFRGRFSEALDHLMITSRLSSQLHNLSLDEDLRDLTCELADTLRELDQPQAAEKYLREEFARRDRCLKDTTAFTGRSLLEASLAEVLFAQGQIEEAEHLCLQAQSRGNLMKFGKLRLAIVLAKLYHTSSNYEKAFHYWNEALKVIASFTMGNGRATRTILLSIHATLGSLNLPDIQNDSLRQVDVMDQLEKPGGTQYWIAGLRHWQNQLESVEVNHSRI